MIVEMKRIEVIGPRAVLTPTLAALQDLGLVHLVDATAHFDGGRASDPIANRRRRHLGRALTDVEAALDDLHQLGAPSIEPCIGACAEGRAARLGARLAATTSRLRMRARSLGEERDALARYEPLFDELEQLLGAGTRRISVYLLLLHDTTALDALRAALDRAIGDVYDLRTHELPAGDTAVLLLVPATRADVIERQLAEARVERAPLPHAIGRAPLLEALPRLRQRLDEVAAELEAVATEAAALARAHGGELQSARRRIHDALIALDAERLAATSSRAFVLDGWVPARARAQLDEALARAVGVEVSIRDIGREQWHAEDAPVVLENPRLFAPFELLTSMMPLPKYGSVDPTPFVAVFFPMLFGIVVGDVGYGAMMAVIALVLRLTSGPDGAGRKVARIAAAVATYTVVFGLLYGELFGDLGARVFGMRALWFDRQEAVLAFLVLAIALGLVHLLVGLVVAAANRWRRDRRASIGRGLTAALLVLVTIALLAVFNWLPAVLATPAVIAVLVAFVAIVVVEGARGLLEMVSILGHVLSYARVMALGTASVMLAVVANQMHGAFGSVAIGIAFALVFHLVNFAITLFSPAIHVMRLHYVEFFDTFFEPGGGPYQPLRHWSPGAAAT